MNPSEQGFLLEELISKAVENFPAPVQNMRETQIKQHFKDNSLNGVDHWIKFGKNNVLVQDKWKEDTNQQEVSQFLECANRLNRRIPRDENIYLLWISKYGPTKNSMTSLNERGVEIISCSINIQDLAKLAVLRIADCLGVDAVAALLSIPNTPLPIPVERASVIIDEEALEILKIRKELTERKKHEELEKVLAQQKEEEDKLDLQEILKTDSALVYKMGLQNGHGDACPWVWNPEFSNHPSVKQMLEGYKELQEFRRTCIPRIEGAIQRAMEDLWADTTDERIFQREEIQNSGGCGWSQPDIKSYLGTAHKTFRDEDYWQTFILEENSLPIFNKEFQKWYEYCQKFLERNKGKPKLYEVIQKNEELEKNLNILRNKNEVLEKKLISICSIVNN